MCFSADASSPPLLLAHSSWVDLAPASLTMLKATYLFCGVRQDRFVLLDSDSRQRPRLIFVSGHFLDGGPRHQVGEGFFSFSGALFGDHVWGWEKFILSQGVCSMLFWH